MWPREAFENMRILLLTQYFDPEPACKFTDLARMLSERGHSVQVITGFPCYPHGRTYDGYRQRLFHEETVNGVTVTRVPQLPDHSRSAWRRALYYVSFALCAATIGLWRARNADVMLVYQSAMPTGLAAWLISRVKRIPYALDVVDLWPESVAASGMMRLRLPLSIIRSLVKFIYRGAARINVITEGYRENLLALGVPANKLSLIHCWPADCQRDALPVDAEFADREQLSGRFNVLYAGIMGPVQNLRAVIEAVHLLKDLPQVQFVMVGDGVEHAELTALAAQTGATNVRFFGRRPAAELHRLYPLVDALLVHLKPDPMSSISIPSKTFGYLAAGRPILMGVEGECMRIVERHRCGLAFRPSDPRALADTVRQLVLAPVSERERMAAAARQAYLKHYRPELQMRKLEQLLEEMAPRRKSSLLRAA